jgi:hypothetical protein
MPSDDTQKPTTTALAVLTVPVTLPLPIIEQVQQGKLRPDELFDVALAFDAEAKYGLDLGVFNIDSAEVQLQGFGSYDPDTEARPQESRQAVLIGEDDYERGHQEGWDDAESFIARHPQGMPWSALRDDEEPEPSDPFDRGRWTGYRARMREEGWPLSRREASDG